MNDNTPSGHTIPQESLNKLQDDPSLSSTSILEISQLAQRKIQELACLYEIGKTLASSLDLFKTCSGILEILARLMGMNRGTITLLDANTDELYIEIAHGLTEKEKRRGRYKIGEGITGKVVEMGEPLIVPQIGNEPLFLNKTGARKKIEKDKISFICVPIKLEERIIGALSVDRLFEQGISLEEDVRLLTIIASMIAQAVKISQMVEEEKGKLIQENLNLQQQLVNRYSFENMIGTSNKMKEVFQLIHQVAKSNTTVLIRGESGTGKELVAKAIHYNSLRLDGPFITVNCASLPESLMESELFGHEKGSFTGALEQKKGKFELAEGGSLFLDEIGELSISTQAKLLRAIQMKEFDRVGGSKVLKVNVRIIAATNKDLEAALKAGTFRGDLYYRLNVFPIYLPHLRERKTDIMLLTEHFVEKYSREINKEIKRISTPAIDMLISYHWPGNVRELENWIERAVLLSTDKVIHSHHFPPTIQTAEASGTQSFSCLEEAVNRYEQEVIIDALKSSNGNISKAARILKTTERIIGYKIRKYRIIPKRYRPMLK